MILELCSYLEPNESPTAALKRLREKAQAVEEILDDSRGTVAHQGPGTKESKITNDDKVT